MGRFVCLVLRVFVKLLCVTFIINSFQTSSHDKLDDAHSNLFLIGHVGHCHPTLSISDQAQTDHQRATSETPTTSGGILPTTEILDLQVGKAFLDYLGIRSALLSSPDCPTLPSGWTLGCWILSRKFFWSSLCLGILC